MNRTVAWSCLLFAAVFGYYLSAAYPTVSTGDSGEFITAARSLGIPHEPGYPLYVVAANATARVIAWGNAAYQVNLFSGLAAAGAAVALLLLAVQAGLTPSAGIF